MPMSKLFQVCAHADHCHHARSVRDSLSRMKRSQRNARADDGRRESGEGKSAKKRKLD